MLWISLFLLTQVKPPAAIYTCTEDSTYVLVVDYPRGVAGLNFYLETEGVWKRINVLPVEPTRDPLMFREMLGDDYYVLLDLLRASEPFELMQRIMVDPGTNFAFSAGYWKIAKASGRGIVLKTEPNMRYRLKIEYLDYNLNPIRAEVMELHTRVTRVVPPTDVKVKRERNKIRISWGYHEFTGKPEDAVTKFNIYRKIGSGGWEKLNIAPIMRTGAKLYYIDKELQEGEEYVYYVTAVTFADQESEPSEKVRIFIRDETPPRPPAHVEAKGEECKILISWDPSLDVDVDYYEVYKATSVTDTFRKISKAPVRETYYEDTDVMGGVQYFYRIVAVDKSGNRSIFSGVACAIPKDYTPPEPPRDVKYEVKDKHVHLWWTASPSPDVIGYNVYRKEVHWLKLNRDTLTNMEFVDVGFHGRGLYPGKTYEFGVTAIDRVGNESDKRVVKVTIPDDMPPHKPIGFYAHCTREGYVELVWQRNVDWDFAFYRLKRNGKLIAELDTVYYLDKKVEAGHEYLYVLVAVDRAGNESEPATRKIVARDRVKPPAPDTIKAKVTDEGVKIEWTPVRVDDLAGYNVYRSDAYAGIYKKLNETLVVSTKFMDKDGKPGMYYKIGVVDYSGNEKLSRPVKAR